MRALATVAAVVLFGAAMGGVGYTLGQPRQTEVQTPAQSVRPWQAVLDEALATADDTSLRGRALEILNTADADHALAEALEALGWVGEDADIPVLDSFARSGDPDLSRPAIDALGRLRRDASLQILLDLVGRREISQGHVLVALGRSGSPAALEVLSEHLHRNEHVAHAAQGLAMMGSPEATAALADGLQRGHPWRVGHIARALGSLAATSPDAHTALQRVMAGPSGPSRGAVLHALAEAKDPLVFDVLIWDLQNASALRASQAANALGALGDPRAVGALANAALEGHGDLRYTSVNALGQLNLAEADRALLKLIEEAPSAVASRAAYALPKPQDPVVLPRLLEARNHRPPEVRNTIDGPTLRPGLVARSPRRRHADRATGPRPQRHVELGHGPRFAAAPTRRSRGFAAPRIAPDGRPSEHAQLGMLGAGRRGVSLRATPVGGTRRRSGSLGPDQRPSGHAQSGHGRRS